MHDNEKKSSLWHDRRRVSGVLCLLAAISIAGLFLVSKLIAPRAQIVFVSEMTGKPQIYLMNEDGSGLHLLSSNSRLANHPAWSPDGKRIAFWSIIDSAAGGVIIVVNVDGTLHSIPMQSYGTIYPAWSPDGKKIAALIGAEGGADLYVMDVDGSNQVRIAPTQVLGNDAPPQWTPDGRLIYTGAVPSAMTIGSQIDLYTVNADGSDARPVTSMPVSLDATWSPDSTRIGLTQPSSDEKSDLTDIVMMNADGSNPVVLAAIQNSSTRLMWSPDGKRILYAATSGDNVDIFAAPTDGSGTMNLTKSPGYDGNAAWSADGRQIVFVSQRDDNSEIYVMNADGSNVRRLTYSAQAEYSPSWQPQSN